ncbi:unnamed protein product [Spirodela intermedia]|uniref:Uncharacterized protein n=1 Tax=Spirodela intermedia TaxID=51605 RepID=A0A7I8K8Q3_SPIIN|nr:unnamed protein product [Spirodela intermedia]
MSTKKLAVALLAVAMVLAMIGMETAEARTCMQVCMPECLKIKGTTIRDCKPACKEGCEPANSGSVWKSGQNVPT